MVSRDVLVIAENGGDYRVRLRSCVSADVDILRGTWAPILDRGPARWLDREWRWEKLDAVDQLAFDVSAQWLVLADEVEAGALHDLIGVLVTTGPVTPAQASLDVGKVGEGGIVWVEYIAIAPSLRPDCPPLDRRTTRLKRIGARLMQAAIERSEDLGCNGRIGLHAEGDDATKKYNEWAMAKLPEAAHPAGGSYPMFFGSADWARDFMNEGKVPS